MTSLINIVLYLLCITTYCACSIILKKVKEKHVFILWTLLIMYVLIYSFFFLYYMHLGHTLTTTLSHLYSLWTTNVPFYLMRSIDLVASNLMLFYLLTHFSISKVALVLQAVIPISALCFFFLGEPLTPTILVGIVIVTIGSILAGFEKIDYKNPLKPLTSISPALYIGGFLKSFLEVTGTLIIFIVSTKTMETKAIQNVIKYNTFSIFKHIHFDSVLDYAIGLGPFILVTYFLYFFIFQKGVSFKTMKNVASKHMYAILLNSALQATCYCLYAFVFQNISNKVLLNILSTADIPITFLFAYMVLNERINLPQKISMVLIVVGTIISSL